MDNSTHNTIPSAQPNPKITCTICGKENVPDWDGKQHCITCARDLVLGPAQPVSDGDELLKRDILELLACMDRDRGLRTGETTKLVNLLAQARQQSYQSGYAAAVGDAVEAAPSKHTGAIGDAERNAALDHYRTAIEALESTKQISKGEENV